MSTKKQLLGALLLAGAMALTLPQWAVAAYNYTPACTKINNTAHISYAVGGVAQGAGGNGVDSPTASFYVGVKVNVTVASTDGANVQVFPNSTGSLLNFTVTNNGNAHQKYALTSITESTNNDTIASPFGGGNDTYDASNITLSLSTIADLAPDTSQAVTVAGDTTSTVVDGKIAIHGVKAQTQWVGSTTNVTTDGTVKGSVINSGICTAAGPDTADIDVVVADGAGSDDAARDGAHSARGAFKVTAANLAIQKSSQVVWDPINCPAYSYGAVCTGTARAIPTAVVEYTIQVDNSANGTATNLTVKDVIDSSLTFLPDGYAALKGIQVTAPNINGGTALALTNASDADKGDYNITNAGAVTVTGIQIAKGETAYVKFRATIK